MPIKEIMTITTVILGSWMIAGGRESMWKNIHKVQIQILREVARTDNWGNPLPWKPRYFK